MHFSDQQIIEVAQHAFIRMDGAWFLALAKKFGIQTAWEMDVEAWKQFSYVFGKNLRKRYLSDPVWPDSFLDALEVFFTILKMEGRKLSVQDGKIIIRITDCETQKAIARAGVADCGIVTIQSYEGIIKGLYDNKICVHVAHPKNLNHGDDCCEVIIDRK